MPPRCDPGKASLCSQFMNNGASDLLRRSLLLLLWLPLPGIAVLSASRLHAVSVSCALLLMSSLTSRHEFTPCRFASNCTACESEELQARDLACQYLVSSKDTLKCIHHSSHTPFSQKQTVTRLKLMKDANNPHCCARSHLFQVSTTTLNPLCLGCRLPNIHSDSPLS